MAKILNYENWRMIYEQAESTEPGELTEEALFNWMMHKIDINVGKDKQLMNKIGDKQIQEAIYEAIIYSDKTPEDFFKNPNKYVFRLNVGERHVKFIGPKVKGQNIPSKIWYVGTKDNPKAKQMTPKKIIEDINFANSNIYVGKDMSSREKKANEKGLVFRLKNRIPTPEERSKLGIPKEVKKILKAVITFPTPGYGAGSTPLQIIVDSKFNPKGKNGKVEAGTQKQIKKEIIKKGVKFDITINTDQKSGSDVTFATQDARITKETAAIDSIYNLILGKAKEQGITEEQLKTLKITKFIIISSASNVWGSRVVATHTNAGEPTGKKWSDEPTNIRGAKLNWDLAVQRGNNLKRILFSGLKNKGLKIESEPEVRARITDTNALVDNSKNKSKSKSKENETKYPNPGQYARLIIEASAEGKTPNITSPSSSNNVFIFTQFALSLESKEKVGDKGYDNPWRWDLTKPKYIKNGKLVGKRYARRHQGGNRPISGLAHWFDKVINGGNYNH